MKEETGDRRQKAEGAAERAALARELRAARVALARCVADIDEWADGESGHVLQGARDQAAAEVR